MRLPLFLALTALGRLLWNAVLVTVGYWLGDRWELVEQYAGTVSKVVLGAVVALLAAWLTVRLRSRGERRAEAGDA